LIVGGVVSRTVATNEPEAALPASSVAVQETVVAPSGNVDPDRGAHATPDGGTGAPRSVALAWNEMLAPAGPFASTVGAAGSRSAGGVASIRHVREAVSAFPAWSTARTSTVCVPSWRPPYETGEPHGAGAAPSSRHVTLADSDVVNVNAADGDVTTPDGPPASVTAGGTVSTVHVQTAAVPGAPSGITGRTWNVCSPSRSVAYETGDEQLENGAPSSRHCAATVAVWKAKVASVALVGLGGPDEIEAAGAATVQR
jgi:hypothetical protein